MVLWTYRNEETLIQTNLLTHKPRVYGIDHMSHDPLPSTSLPEECEGNCTPDRCSQEHRASSPPSSQLRALVFFWEGWESAFLIPSQATCCRG